MRHIDLANAFGFFFVLFRLDSFDKNVEEFIHMAHNGLIRKK